MKLNVYNVGPIAHLAWNPPKRGARQFIDTPDRAQVPVYLLESIPRVDGAFDLVWMEDLPRVALKRGFEPEMFATGPHLRAAMPFDDWLKRYQRTRSLL
ncbi:hypothetical protein [Rhodobacter sp. SY28-1]|uniref:hypothetical protein n=1 Tax=Rhodobacter sp. SY28-1 TaxID=2562317 RepID=UPI0010BFB93F|nr:hypothetical protein [Rhodobacter sp. SY28-1]